MSGPTNMQGLAAMLREAWSADPKNKKKPQDFVPTSKKTKE